MAALQAGESVQIGGGRCFVTYELRAGQVVRIDFDEGHIDETPFTEAQLREALLANRSPRV